MTNIKFQQALENFKKSTTALKRALEDPIVSDRDCAGVIKSFEFTYELAWKTLKRYLENQGHETTTARDTFKKAYSLDVIDDEQTWLNMIEDRNATTHTYNPELAKELIENIKTFYLQLFEKLLAKVSTP